MPIECVLIATDPGGGYVLNAIQAANSHQLQPLFNFQMLSVSQTESLKNVIDLVSSDINFAILGTSTRMVWRRIVIAFPQNWCLQVVLDELIMFERLNRMIFLNFARLYFISMAQI